MTQQGQCELVALQKAISSSYWADDHSQHGLLWFAIGAVKTCSMQLEQKWLVHSLKGAVTCLFSFSPPCDYEAMT